MVDFWIKVFMLRPIPISELVSLQQTGAEYKSLQ